MLTHQVLALPATALAALAAQFISVQAAVALVSVSMVASNVTQAAEGGQTIQAIRQMSPILLLLAIGTFIGVHLLVTIDRRVLQIVLGAGFLLLAALLTAMPRVRLQARTARWAGPA